MKDFIDKANMYIDNDDFYNLKELVKEHDIYLVERPETDAKMLEILSQIDTTYEQMCEEHENAGVECD